jgi:hypothetical protein
MRKIRSLDALCPPREEIARLAYSYGEIAVENRFAGAGLLRATGNFAAQDSLLT